MAGFVLEGVDGTGKTTLAKRLCKAYDLNYVRIEAPGSFPFSSFFNAVSSKINSVIDRGHLTPYAYGITYRGKSDIDEQQFIFVDKVLDYYGYSLVMCRPPIDIIMKVNSGNRKNLYDMHNIDDVGELLKHFDKAYLSSNMHKVQFNFLESDLPIYNHKQVV